MKTLVIKISFIMILFSGIVCNSTHGKEAKSSTTVFDKTTIEVYYFHYTRRCATCLAVENVTKETLENYYKVQLESEDILFKSINLDEPNSDKLAERLGVSGQTLLIVAGEQKENITTDAFLNAKSNPDKLEELIKLKIDPLLKK